MRALRSKIVFSLVESTDDGDQILGESEYNGEIDIADSAWDAPNKTELVGFGVERILADMMCDEAVSDVSQKLVDGHREPLNLG